MINIRMENQGKTIIEAESIKVMNLSSDEEETESTSKDDQSFINSFEDESDLEELTENKALILI